MARRYEGSKADEREDARGSRNMGVSRRDYEKSSRDKREDAAGQKRMDAGGMRKGGVIKHPVRRYAGGGSVQDYTSGRKAPSPDEDWTGGRSVTLPVKEWPDSGQNEQPDYNRKPAAPTQPYGKAKGGKVTRFAPKPKGRK